MRIVSNLNSIWSYKIKKNFPKIKNEKRIDLAKYRKIFYNDRKFLFEKIEILMKIFYHIAQSVNLMLALLLLVIIYQNLLFHLKMYFRLILKINYFIIVFKKIDESVERIKISGLNKLHVLITKLQIGLLQR